MFRVWGCQHMTHFSVYPECNGSIVHDPQRGITFLTTRHVREFLHLGNIGHIGFRVSVRVWGFVGSGSVLSLWTQRSASTAVLAAAFLVESLQSP